MMAAAVRWPRAGIVVTAVVILALIALAGAQEFSPEALVKRGLDRFREGNVEAARRDYEEAVARRRNFHEAHAGLAQVDERQGNLSQALLHWEEASRLEPSNPFYRHQAVRVREQLSRAAQPTVSATQTGAPQQEGATPPASSPTASAQVEIPDEATVRGAAAESPLSLPPRESWRGPQSGDVTKEADSSPPPSAPVDQSHGAARESASRAPDRNQDPPIPSAIRGRGPAVLPKSSASEVPRELPPKARRSLDWLTASGSVGSLLVVAVSSLLLATWLRRRRRAEPPLMSLSRPVGPEVPANPAPRPGPPQLPRPGTPEERIEALARAYETSSAEAGDATLLAEAAWAQVWEWLEIRRAAGPSGDGEAIRSRVVAWGKLLAQPAWAARLAERYQRLGEEHGARGDSEAALSAFWVAMVLDPNCTRAAVGFNLERVNMLTKSDTADNLQTALACAEEAATMDPSMRVLQIRDWVKVALTRRRGADTQPS
jgi:tetratricopeptide (TPR) repeat protein